MHLDRDEIERLAFGFSPLGWPLSIPWRLFFVAWFLWLAYR